MSYDLHLFRSEPGSDPLAGAKASMDFADEDVNPGPVNPAAEAWKETLVAALRSANPALTPFVFDYAEIARLQSVSEVEARRRWRHIELNGPEDGNDIQLTLHDHSASVTVPYWHQGDVARDVWREIWRYLDILQRDGQLAVYDPQLDRVLDLAKDREAVAASYAQGVNFTKRVAAERPAAQKPWWKVW